jgi:hypothetical protein
MSSRTWRITLAIGVVIATSVGPLGCATTEPEMIPVERVVNYSETADYSPMATGVGYGPLLPATAAECREYRETLEKYEKVYLASVGVGVVSLVVGLLSDDDDVKDVAGVAAATSTLAQAGTSTAYQIVAQEARERGCDLN